MLAFRLEMDQFYVSESILAWVIVVRRCNRKRFPTVWEHRKTTESMP